MVNSEENAHFKRGVTRVDSWKVNVWELEPAMQ